MVRAANFQPNWASAPGRTIVEIMAARGLSLLDLAQAINVPQTVAQELTSGNAKIDKEIAQGLALTLGPSASFWLNREQQYRSDLARVAAANQAASAHDLLRKLPIADMRRFGWIGSATDKAALLESCLRFFDVANADEWHLRYSQEVAVAAFRTSATYESNPYAVAAWLRRAYVESERIECQRWNEVALRQLLPQMRALSRVKEPERFIPQLVRLCASVGVALVIAQVPKGCRASGATRFLTPHKALVVLSMRHRSDDHFWFTFFHEIAHLLLHSHDAMFIEDDSGVTEVDEAEANDFAASVLIPIEHENNLRRLKPAMKPILTFARSIGIAPGIVVGQLQHRGIIRQDRLNGLKRRYKWDNGDVPRLIL